VVCPDRNQKLHLRQPAAAPAANLQQKLAERLYCALAPAMDTSGRATEPPSPTADGAESHSKTSAPPLSMAARQALRPVRSMQCEEGNFTIGIIAKRLAVLDRSVAKPGTPDGMKLALSRSK
jgi:hypothetical protein